MNSAAVNLPGFQCSNLKIKKNMQVSRSQPVSPPCLGGRQTPAQIWRLLIQPPVSEHLHAGPVLTEGPREERGHYLCPVGAETSTKCHPTRGVPYSLCEKKTSWGHKGIPNLGLLWEPPSCGLPSIRSSLVWRLCPGVASWGASGSGAQRMISKVIRIITERS